MKFSLNSLEHFWRQSWRFSINQNNFRQNFWGNYNRYSWKDCRKIFQKNCNDPFQGEYQQESFRKIKKFLWKLFRSFLKSWMSSSSNVQENSWKYFCRNLDKFQGGIQRESFIPSGKPWCFRKQFVLKWLQEFPKSSIDSFNNIRKVPKNILADIF